MTSTPCCNAGRALDRLCTDTGRRCRCNSIRTAQRTSLVSHVSFLAPPHRHTHAQPSDPPTLQDRFSTAIEEEWYGELFVDDLPMWIFVGEGESEDFLLGHTDKSKHWLFTHFVFTVGMNGDRVVSANVTVSPERRADITLHDPAHEDVPDLGASKSSGRLGAPASGGSGAAGGGGHGHSHRRNVDSHAPAVKVRFTYSVRFVQSDTPYEARMAVYEDSAFLPATLEIHWLSIINSLVLVVLLTAFLGIILLRVVRNDFTRYMRADDEEEAAEEETGWKLLHGDVFRPPANLSLFAAMVGTGVQLLLMTTALLSLAFFGAFSLARRGSIVAACIVLYVLTTWVGAYVSARLYKQMRGGAWVWNVLLSLMVVPVPITATFAVLNTTALVKNSTAALPWGTIAVVVMLFAFLALPLGVLGGIAGHHSSEYEPPCRVAKVPRQIPAVPFYRSLPAQLFMAGFLPFSAISIELHYIFASVWGHKVSGTRIVLRCRCQRGARMSVLLRGGACTRRAPFVCPQSSASLRLTLCPLSLCPLQLSLPSPSSTAGVHAVRHPLPGLRAAGPGNRLHHRRPHLLPARQ